MFRSMTPNRLELSGWPRAGELNPARVGREGSIDTVQSSEQAFDSSQAETYEVDDLFTIVGSRDIDLPIPEDTSSGSSIFFCLDREPFTIPSSVVDDRVD